MSFSQAIKTCFSKYFVIQGRAPRSEYWWFSLFLILVGGTLGLIAFIAGVGALVSALSSNGGDEDTIASLAIGAVIAGILAFIFFLAIIAPSITVLVRRFHDVGLSGWWIGGYWIANIVVTFITGIGTGLGTDSTATSANIFGLLLNLASIAIFIVTLLPSQAGVNKYGPNPLGGNGDFPTLPPPPGDYKPL